jgi:hypothetical protein
MRLTLRRPPSTAPELPVHKWVEDLAQPERRTEESWPREIVKRRERLQRERAASRESD